MRGLVIGGLALMLGSAALAQTPASIPVAATIDAGKPSASVSKYQYGMFIEHIDKLIYRTLWAEMLDDRKFYYPVTPESGDPKPQSAGDGPPRFGARKWRPLGGDDAVTMDTHNPYVGAQSASVTVGAAPRGLAQAGLTLVKGKAYAGHIVLRGSRNAKVSVALVWGPGAADRQTLQIATLGDGWRSSNLKFTAGAGTADGRLEISGTGAGDFQVGVVSLMPADNVDGWRPDTTALLRTLHSGMWRLPGGNFLSDHDWHDAIGNRDTRPPTYDHAWSAMQSNDVGMDEFMTLCRLIDVEPYITVNAGFGDANSAAEEVEYMNGPATNYWGALRAKNGHPAPYAVKYWDIGNEPYGWWQIGKTTLEYFVLKHNEFAARMRKADPSIILMGSGAMPDQMHAKEAKENASLESIQPKFGTDLDWTGGLLAHSWGNFEGLTEHWYDKAEKRPDAPPGEELLEFVRQPSNQVRMKADEWAIYEQRFPAMKEKGIFLAIDEYAITGAPPDLKTALAYSMVLQEMLRHTDFLKMSAFTMGVSTLDITPDAVTLNSTGEVFKLYGAHFGAGEIPVAVTGNAPQPAMKYPVGYDHPTVVAGSPTYPLDIIAGLSADHRKLTIAVVNATFQSQPLSLTLAGVKVEGPGKRYLLTGASLDAANKVGQAPGVTIQESAVGPLDGALTVAPLSTSVYEFPVAN
jgi:alpha-N-arabinofuranosidase